MADAYVPEATKLTSNDGTVVVEVANSAAAINQARIAGNAISTGSGVLGTGTQRVVLATDQPVIPVSDNGGSLTVDGSVSITGAVEVANDAGNPLPISATTGANALTNPLFTRLTDGTNAIGTGSNPLSVTFDGATGTLVDSGRLTSAALAAAATANLDSANVGAGLTGKLLEITASSTVNMRVDIIRVEASNTTSRTFIVAKGTPFTYRPTDRDAITVAGAASGRNFRLAITNLDNNQAADVYASITHETA